jgi:signal transduction histidine kinase
LASLIGFSGGSTNFLLVFDIVRIPPIGNYFIALYLFVLFYAIVKHQLMDINIVLKKGTTYALLLVLLYVPAFILILLAQKAFFQKIDTFFSVILFSIFFLVTLFFQKIKPRTERTVEQFLFKDRYDYRETLARFSKAMVSILDLRSLLQKIIETITQTMKVEKASLFLLNEERGGYDLYESKNAKMNSPPSHLSKGDPLPSYLQKIGEVTILEELMKGAHLSELNQVTEQMSSLEAEVSIPLTSKGRLIGIMNLSHKFDKDFYSQEDVDLLTTLANQTAIALENARLYEDLKKSKSYIRRADRLASLGTLTAGLAHEIRNPLTAIKTLTQLLPERLEDEEFRNEFLHIASGEVDRISSLVNELLEFARPSDPKFELEEINPILDGMILLTSTESKKKKIEIVRDYLQDLPPISIDREQVKQVFLNILLNAIEATPANGKIVVKTRSYLKPGGTPYLQVEIADNGSGIPREFLEDIFNPFFTTKPKGSGLGLSISNQIVQDHDGYIHVESQVNRGSSFFINLPLTQDMVRPKRRIEDIEDHPDY